MAAPADKKRSLSIRQRSFMLVCFPLIAEITFIILFTMLHIEAESQAEHAARARATTAFVNEIISHVYALGKKIDGYKLHADLLDNGNDQTLQRVKDDLQKIETFEPLSSAQAADLNRIRQNGEKTLALLEQARKMLNPLTLQSLTFAKVHAYELNTLCAALFDDLEKVIDEDNRIEDSVPIVQSRVRHQSIIMIYALVAVNALIAVFLTSLYNRDIVRRLSLVMDNAQRLGEHKPLNPRLSGDDEIAQLDGVFNDMADALADAARVKQELFSMVSHDLRTPLTSIQSALFLVLDGAYGKVSADVEGALATSERELRRLVALVLDLLEVARLDEPTIALEKEKIAVAPFLEQIRESFDAQCSSKQISIEIATESNLFVHGDEYRLTQVLVNLISNALKYSPQGSHITLTCASSPGSCRFTVEDEGPGIPKEAVQEIFERFKQAHASDRKSGFGLGLSICQRIVEFHQGSIGVENKIPHGACFWFIIPFEGE